MEKRSNRRKKKNSSRAGGVVLFSLLALASISLLGLVLGDSLTLDMFGMRGSDTEEGYKNVTLTDAQYYCEKEARDEFGSRMRTITIDSLSSRYDAQHNRYKMFFRADVTLKNGEQERVVEYFLDCFVHGSRGSITFFDNVLNEDDGAKPVRKTEGNVFGM